MNIEKYLKTRSMKWWIIVVATSPLWIPLCIAAAYLAIPVGIFIGIPWLLSGGAINFGLKVCDQGINLRQKGRYYECM